MKFPEDIYYIMDRLNGYGYEAFLVGGAVRNILLNLEVKDYDITTNAKPSELVGLFKKTILTGVRFGTVTVVIDSRSYEITTYRRDYEYLDSRRPSVVSFSDELEEDLTRRDFTINAICMDKEGTVIDPLNGMVDIIKGIIRAIGNPDIRFKEDALRMMRAIRLMAEIEFTIEENTLKSITKNASTISNISSERIQNELNKILLSRKPSTGLFKMLETGILGTIMPEIIPCVGFKQFSSYHDKDVFSHTMIVMDNTLPKLEIRLAALFHDIDKPNCLTIDENGEGHFYGHHIESARISKEVLKRLKYPNDVIEKVYRLIRYHPLKEINIGEKGVKRFINKVGKDNLEDMFNLNYADIIGKSTYKGIDKLKNMEEHTRQIINRHDPLNIRDLEISGRDIKELGIREGPLIGEILDRLMALAFENPEENNREKLLQHIKEMIKENPLD
jgi:tRNA nucleotidyltransferase (CCA-adding enzyme)